MTLRGACDSHIHVYDRRCAAAASASLRPPDASLADYSLVQATLGTERAVVVQPTTYGLDNRLHLAALSELGSLGRGVMVVDRSTTSDELTAMTAAGVRGARMHLLPGGAVDRSELEVVARAIAPFGWHMQLQLDGHELATELDRLRRLPVPLVIDHVGRFMPPTTPDGPAFAALLALVDDGAHVKLSAPYESAPDVSHRHVEVSSCVAALVERAPDRLLWASNWPHPGQADPPSTARLVELRDEWLPTAALREQVLVTNPARLYDF